MDSQSDRRRCIRKARQRGGQHQARPAGEDRPQFVAVHGGGNARRGNAADRHSLQRRAGVSARSRESGERKVRAAGAPRRQPGCRQHGPRARERRPLDAQRELRLGVRVLPLEPVRQRGNSVLRYAPGPARAQARQRRREPGSLREERHLRRGARRVRRCGSRRGQAGDGRGGGHRLACGDSRRHRLGARGAPGRSLGNAIRRLRPRRLFMKTRLAIAGALLTATVQAQEAQFPHKGAIEITVLFPAGSSADVTARLLADGMSKQLGAKVIVYNRPGAGGAIGYTYVAAPKPDRYWLVWNSNSISTTYHSGSLPFDYQAFDAVARVLVESPVLAVGGGAKWKTLADLVADAKSRPKQISVGHSGIGSHTHISA